MPARRCASKQGAVQSPTLLPLGQGWSQPTGGRLQFKTAPRYAHRKRRDFFAQTPARWECKVRGRARTGAVAALRGG
jgi:hypothetical protein